MVQGELLEKGEDHLGPVGAEGTAKWGPGESSRTVCRGETKEIHLGRQKVNSSSGSTIP